MEKQHKPQKFQPQPNATQVELNYDSEFDILYARLSDYPPSFGDENQGIITFHSIETGATTGMAICNAKQRIQRGEAEELSLPLPIDLNSQSVQTLLNSPEKGYRCTIQLP